MTMFRVARHWVPLLAATLFLASCGGGGTVDNDVAFRFIQASPDAPLVNLRVDGTALRSAVPYKGGSGFIFVTPRQYDFSLEAILSGGNQVVLDAPGTPLEGGREYSVIAIGKDATDTVQPLIFSNAIESIPAGSARLQLAHAAPDQPPLDVYLTAPGAVLAAAVPIGQISYGDMPAARQLVDEGTYVLSVTPAGVTTPVLFQSTTITLHSRDDWLLVAVANTAPGVSPISIVVDNHFATGQTSVLPEILDKDTPADVSVINLSPDAPAIDVIGDPVAQDAPDVSFASNLNYLENTAYVSVAPDGYAVRGVPSSDPLADPPLFDFSRNLIIGQRLTVLALGLLATIDDTVLVDDIRPVYAQGKLRIIDAAPAANIVDVYIVPAGTDVASVEAPTLCNLGLRSATGHFGFTPDNYTVTFTEAGGKTLIASANVAAGPGSVQTVILHDAVRVDDTSDGKPAGILIIDDLTQAATP
ncbi:MAG: DUF4397 domain-containing protein [Gammaproteobacteria bacterium]